MGKWHCGDRQPGSRGARRTPSPGGVLFLVNEAVACVADHVVADADLADAGTIFGAGFAPFRGGPIRYARDAGVDNVVERAQGLRERYGERFKPAYGWADIAGIKPRMRERVPFAPGPQSVQ